MDWFGQAHGNGLFRLARANDNRTLIAEREAKSVSAEDTFDIDVTDRTRLGTEIDLLAARVGGRLRTAGLSGRTVTLKVRHYDFTTITRSSTRAQPTDDPRLIAQLARKLFADVDTATGIRLLGVGVTTLADFVQDDLFTDIAINDADSGIDRHEASANTAALPSVTAPLSWRPGQDVHHEQYGPGWVWGSGLGRVSVRFEGPTTAPGPVRTFAIDDAHLRPADPPDWTTPLAGR